MKIKILLLVILVFTTSAIFSQIVDNKFSIVKNYIETGKYNEAILILNGIIKTDSKNYIYFETLANLYDKINDSDNAIKYYNEAISLNPECANCYAGLAKAFFDKGETETSQEYIIKGLELNKEIPLIYYVRGLIEQQNGKHENAISDFNKAILLDNTNDEFFMARANYYIRKSDLRNAYNDLTSAIKINPENSQYLYYRAFILFNMNNLDEALNNINNAIKINDSVSDYYNLRFSFYREKKDYVNAQASVLKSIELNPGDYNAHINLGDMYFEIGEYSSYCNSYRNAIDLIPESENNMKLEIEAKYNKYCDVNSQSYYYIRSLAEFNNKNYDNCITLADEGIKLKDSEPILHNIKGSALLAKKDYKLAKAEFEKCINLKNNFADNITNYYSIRVSSYEIENITNSYIVKSYLGIAISDLCINNPDNALVQINNAIEIAENIHKFDGIEYLYNTKALIFARKADVSSSDSEISKALKAGSGNNINFLTLAAIELLSASEYSPEQLKFEYLEELKIPRIIFPQLKLKENKRSNINEIFLLCDKVIEKNKENSYAYQIKTIASQLINDVNTCEYAKKAKEYGLDIFPETGLICD